MTGVTRGLLIVNTGNGKGKTTAALGLALRAWGHGMPVVVLQFIKRARTGELVAARRMGIEMVAGGAGFTRTEKSRKANRLLAVELWKMAKEKLVSGTYGMVILDEMSYPLQYGWLPLEEVVEALRNRPPEVHVVITGRDMPAELIEIADLVTEMKEIKHPLGRGIKAQRGIEF